MKKGLVILLILAILLAILFSIRTLNSKELDDVSPEFSCSEKLLEKNDIFFVIPKFNNISIAEDKAWCEYILSFNKTIALHGVYHEYREFKTERNQEYLQEGINIFEECFGFKPTIFKPPQRAISKENTQLIKNNNIKVKKRIDKIIHRIDHCPY